MTVRNVCLAAISCLILGAFTACTKEAGATVDLGGMTQQVTKKLESITDAQTAESMKSELATLTDQLTKAVDSAKTAVGGAMDEWMTPEVKSAFASTRSEIDRLLANPDIEKAIGPTLQKLKDLVGAG